jgi:hypothetical protein
MLECGVGDEWTIVEFQDGEALSGAASSGKLTDSVVGDQFAV